MADNGYDFIIVGAGSSGSVLANQLSENGKYTVYVLKQEQPTQIYFGHVFLPVWNNLSTTQNIIGATVANQIQELATDE